MTLPIVRPVNESATHGRVTVVDLLRGLAAFGVCWFHCTGGLPGVWSNGPFATIGKGGQLGIYVFFVISGFVLPYSMDGSRYQVRDWGRFVFKRVARLDPPYLVAMLMGVVIARVLIAFVPSHASDPAPTWTQVALHLAYLVPFTHQSWLIGVFWSLAVEFQYYLLLGILFPLIVSANKWLRAALFVALGSISLVGFSPRFVFHWWFFFLMGWAVFLFRSARIEKGHLGLLVFVLGLGCWYTDGLPAASAATATGLSIAFLSIQARGIFAFLGRISYSLYLVHQPIEEHIVNLGLRFGKSVGWKLLFVGLAVGASLLVAWLVYLFVERPAQRWASRIRTAPARRVAVEERTRSLREPHHVHQSRSGRP